MKIKISKDEIIKAIEKEALTHMVWIADAEGDNEDVQTIGDKDCAVCAVGSVLRSVMDKKCTGAQLVDVVEKNILEATEDIDGGIQRALEEERYLDALSMKFENMSGGGARVKKALRKFVEKNFPAHINVEIPKAYLKEKEEMKMTLEEFIGGKLPFQDAHIEAEKRRELQPTGGTHETY